MKRIIPFCFFLSVFGVSCSSSCSSSTPEEALEDKGLTEVLEDAAEDEYTPPDDGKLTEKQLQMYLAVKKREAELAKAAAEQLKEKGADIEKANEEGRSLTAALSSLSALRDFGNFATADIRAAQELGYNTAEYLWVKEQVLEAGAASIRAKWQEQSGATLRDSLQRMKESRESATNEQVRQMLDQQIAQLEAMLQQQEEQEEDSEAVEHNRQLIQKFAPEIDLLEKEIQKYGLLGR